jgi:hypothetical protein
MEELFEGGLARAYQKSQTRSTGNISAERGELSKSENRSRSKELESKLRERGYGFKKVEGQWIENQGTPDERPVKERSYSVDAPPEKHKQLKKDLKDLGREFSQDAVISKKAGKEARVHDTKGKDPSFNIGHMRPGKSGEMQTRVGNKTYTYESVEAYEAAAKKWEERLKKERKERPLTHLEKENAKAVMRTLMGLRNGGDGGRVGPAPYAVMQTCEFGIDEEVEKKLDGVIDEPPKTYKSPEEIANKHGVSVGEIESQLKKGIKIETEHTNDLDQARIIALQHLAEVPDYYTKLKKVEEEWVGSPKFPKNKHESKVEHKERKRREHSTHGVVEIEPKHKVKEIEPRKTKEPAYREYVKTESGVKELKHPRRPVQEIADPTIQAQQQLIMAQKKLAAAKQQKLQKQKAGQMGTDTELQGTQLEYFMNYVRENGSLNTLITEEPREMPVMTLDESFESGWMPLEEAKVLQNGRAYDVVFRHHGRIQTVSFYVADVRRPTRVDFQRIVSMFYPDAKLLMFYASRGTRDNMVMVASPNKIGGYSYQKEDWEPLSEEDSEELEMLLEEGEKLGKITRTPGGPKKFMVKVKDPSTGNVKTVRFGDPNMEIKRDDPDRRKNFRARHNCDDPGPRTKARYWACRTWENNKSVNELT